MKTLSGKKWINFKELRSRLKFSEVLSHYHIEAKVKGDRAYACCPLPGHPVRKDAKKRTASLSIHLKRGVFQCFGCRTGGNVAEFVALMEGLDPNDPRQFREAAVKMAEIFNIQADGGHPGRRPDDDPEGDKPAEGKAEAPKQEEVSPTREIVVNAPLDFELKHLDPAHPYLSSRGFLPETILYFGLGYCDKGLMKGRVAIPVHNLAGDLVGYAGRLVDNESSSEEMPKYLFPGSRAREGKLYEFHKSKLLYNGHRVIPNTDIVVVEGFPSVWWLYQHGFANVVAVMGSSLSQDQCRMLIELTSGGGRIAILADGDDAGELLASGALPQLAAERWCRWLRLPPGKQPTDLPESELHSLIAL